MATSIESLPPPGWDGEGFDGLLAAFLPGRLSEIVGPRSSGGGSLLLALLSRATARGGLVALVDASDSLDPVTAARAGLDLRALLWVRCGGRPASAWSAVDLLARCTGFAAVALDLGTAGGAAGDTVPPSLGTRLQRAAEGSGAAVIVRTPRHLLGGAAALVVSVRRVRAHWIGAGQSTLLATRLGGLVSEARVLRSRSDPRLATPERAWLIEWQT